VRGSCTTEIAPLQVFPFFPQTPSVDMSPEPVLQFPNAVWHPAPQWVVVAPQNPLGEQHSPKAEPLQVFPFFPQLPSVDTTPNAPALQVPKAVWHPTPQCVGDAPQYPLDEQQSPNPDPLQDFPFLPQDPSVDTPAADASQVPKPDWQPAPQ
jgi:hypothetical protein